MLYSELVEGKKCSQCKEEAIRQIKGIGIENEIYACHDCYEAYWKYNHIIIED